jgi:phosphatidate cytidylyltransferase
VSAFSPGNRRNLVLRTVTGLILFPLAVWLTVLGGWPFALMAGAAAAVGAAELILMFGAVGEAEFGAVGVAEIFGILVAGMLPVAAALPAGEANLFPAWTVPVLAFAVVVLLSAFLFRRAPLEEIPPRVATVALSWLYTGLLLATAVGLSRRGVAWVILAYVVTWGNDTTAYFVGHALGRHRMLERVSPKKTWEGFVGGVGGSIGFAFAWRALSRLWYRELEALTPLETVLLALGGAALGPLGDFCESLFKRAAGVKDSSKIIPGHGGLLDRIDALLFVAPWVYVWAVYLVP